MNSDFPRQRVLAELSWGRDGAISIGKIAERLKWPRRQVEHALHDLTVEDHYPVLGATSGEHRGMYLGQVGPEVAAYSASLRSRAVGQFARAAALERVAATMKPAEQLIAWIDL